MNTPGAAGAASEPHTNLLKGELVMASVYDTYIMCWRLVDGKWQHDSELSELSAGLRNRDGGIDVEAGGDFWSIGEPNTGTWCAHSHKITGTDFHDVLCGGSGNDTIKGGGGDDYLRGYSGILGRDPLIHGNNYLDGGAGNDTLVGGVGNDSLGSGPGGNVYLDGGRGDDTLLGEDGKDTFFFGRGDGHDIVKGATSEDVLKLGQGIAAADLSATMNGNGLVLSIGTDQSITLRDWGDGLPQATLYDGTTVSLQSLLDGTAGGGNSGDNGDNGDSGGGSGGSGGSGGGNSGGGDISTHPYGSDGIKTQPYGSEWYADPPGEPGKTNTAKTKGGKLNGTDNNDRLTGRKGKDTINGKGGHDRLSGGGGNDKLSGGKGNDWLNGGAGNDTLLGGKGKDKLSGGAGNDVFLFTTKAGKKNVDAITDFRHGEDTIALKRSIFSSLSAGQLGAENFCTVGKKNNKKIQGLDADDHIIYNTKTGALLYDRDGKGGVSAVQFAQLGTKKRHPTNISAEDFFVVE